MCLLLQGVRVLANPFAVNASPPDIDLSHSKSLRTLEIAARFVLSGEPGYLTHALSTITSPAFHEVVIVYRDSDLSTQHLHISSGPFGFVVEEKASWYSRQFDLFREMHKIRDFRLVLFVDVWDYAGDYTALERAVKVEKERRAGTGDILPEPLVVYSPRRSRHEHYLDGF